MQNVNFVRNHFPGSMRALESLLFLGKEHKPSIPLLLLLNTNGTKNKCQPCTVQFLSVMVGYFDLGSCISLDHDNTFLQKLIKFQ